MITQCVVFKSADTGILCLKSWDYFRVFQDSGFVRLYINDKVNLDLDADTGLSIFNSDSEEEDDISFVHILCKGKDSYLVNNDEDRLYTAENLIKVIYEYLGEAYI